MTSMVSIRHEGDMYVGLCVFAENKDAQLFYKIIRIGYIIQMVKDKDIPSKSKRSSYVIVSQCNVHSLHYSGNDVSVGSDLPK